MNYEGCGHLKKIQGIFF